MKPWVLTVVFAAAAGCYALRAIRAGRTAAATEVLHALMSLGMLAMAWHHMLSQALAVVFFLGSVWAVVRSSPATCLMAFGMALTFTPVDL